MFQDFVSIGAWNIVVTICNTIITFLIVKKFLFKPVRKMLAARAEEVQAMYDQAETDRAEAAAMKKDYTDSIANAKAEATQITQNATRRDGALRGDPRRGQPSGNRHEEKGRAVH